MKFIITTLLRAGILSLLLASQFAFAVGPVTEARPIKTKVQKVDYGVFGPVGEAMIYFWDKDSDEVVIRNCVKETDTKIITKRDDCQKVGPENRVSREIFKRRIARLFQILDPEKLKPFTAQELKVLPLSNPKRKAIAEEKKRKAEEALKLAEEVLHLRGGDDATVKKQKQLLAEAQRELEGASTGDAAIQRLNALIEEIVDKKIKASDFHWVSEAGYSGIGGSQDTDKSDAKKLSSKLVYNLLKQHDASLGECGTDEILHRGGGDQVPEIPNARGAWLENFIMPQAMAALEPSGTVAYRINDCAALPDRNSTKVIHKDGKDYTWNLVARKKGPSGQYYEVWRDADTGLLWGDTIYAVDWKDAKYFIRDSCHRQVGFDYALKMDCDANTIMEHTACESSEGKLANAGVSEKKFEVPTTQDFKKAEEHGIREVLPNMDYLFWTTTLINGLNADEALGASTFAGGSGYHGSVRRGYSRVAVRCVGR